ncbi:MAG: hypothetical protein HZB66_01730 [Candidatus Aenigmarchaeota archaeon]|nr:hypothetical protein [Candidatus Aenigmarchaeota archaeon]
MNQNLSLLEYCIPCKAKCCKTSSLIGSPILSYDEAFKIKKISSEAIKEITIPKGKKYYVIEEQKGTNKCFFLTNENNCRIQYTKPLDCLCYPIKAVYNKTIKFVIDDNCPAAKHLTNDFITNAKSVALESIKRFDEQTCDHWLENFDIWASKKYKPRII